MADPRVAEIVEAMQRELSPELVDALTDLPITEVPEGLVTAVEAEIEPYDPARPDSPEGTELDCATLEEPDGRDDDIDADTDDEEGGPR